MSQRIEQTPGQPVAHKSPSHKGLQRVVGQAGSHTHSGLQGSPPQVGSQIRFPKQRPVHSAGQPSPHGSPLHNRSHWGISLQRAVQWFCGQTKSVHSSGHPSPHGFPPHKRLHRSFCGQTPGLQKSPQVRVPHGLPPQSGSQIKLSTQKRSHSSGQFSLQGLPPEQSKSQSGRALQRGEQWFCGQMTEHSSGHPTLHGPPPHNRSQFGFRQNGWQ